MSKQDDKTEVIKAEVAPVLAQAGRMLIRNATDYAGAAEFLKAIKAAQKRVADHFGPMKTAAHAAWKAITGKEAETLAPLIEAEKMVKTRMVDYQLNQEQIRRLEQARLQAIADAEAERERARLEREAARLKTPEIKDARLEQAAAVVAKAVTVASVVPKVAGQHVTKRWRAEVKDKRAAMLAVMAFPDWEAYVGLNHGELDRLANRTKGAVAVAGVEFREVLGMSSRWA